MSRPVDVLAVMDAVSRFMVAGHCSQDESDHAERLAEARSAVAEMVDAADYAANLLHEYGAPTRPQRQEAIAKLRDAVARVGGAK